MVVILIGPPGSGKGTQAQFLSMYLKLPHISTGDMFRRAISDGTEEGAQINEYMSKGQLVPSDFVNKVVEKHLSLPEYQHGCILDGYPRTLEQAEFLDDIVSLKIKVLYFEVDDQIVIKRILGRFTCGSCGAIYNKYYTPTMRPNVCDICHSQEFNYRHDDNEQVLAQRLQQYHKQTFPLVQYYKSHQNLYIVNAAQATEQVTRELENIVQQFK